MYYYVILKKLNECDESYDIMKKDKKRRSQNHHTQLLN